MSLIREALFREEVRARRHDAALQAADADAALVSLGQDGVTAGYATIVIGCGDQRGGRRALRLIRQTTDSLGFVTEAEGVNAEAWLGTPRQPTPMCAARRSDAHPCASHSGSAICRAWDDAAPYGPPLMLAASDGRPFG